MRLAPDSHRSVRLRQRQSRFGRSGAPTDSGRAGAWDASSCREYGLWAGSPQPEVNPGQFQIGSLPSQSNGRFCNSGGHNTHPGGSPGSTCRLVPQRPPALERHAQHPACRPSLLKDRPTGRPQRGAREACVLDRVRPTGSDLAVTIEAGSPSPGRPEPTPAPNATFGQAGSPRIPN